VAVLVLELSSLEKLGLVAQGLQEYCSRVDYHKEAVLAVAVDESVSGRSLTTLAEVFHWLLRLANNTEESLARLYDGIEGTTWRLHVHECALFALVLSPLYAQTHPRHIRDVSVFVFQPERLFEAFGVTSGPKRAAIGEMVRKQFSLQGKLPYASAHTARIPKARRIILSETGDGIEWWQLH
jgi:hypothetical protein